MSEASPNKYTTEDLKEMQSWNLGRKIQVTQTRIIEFYERNDGNVYVSFSGGKDSTVLLDLARRIYPDIPAVFVDTGLEYPELREFIKTIPNVTWLKPNRFQKLKQTHPKLWDYCLKDWDDGGLGMKDVLKFINVKYE